MLSSNVLMFAGMGERAVRICYKLENCFLSNSFPFFCSPVLVALEGAPC